MSPFVPSQKACSGPADRVPCPHCGATNDMRAIDTEEHLLEVGAEISCDHCGRVMTVVGVRPVKIVAVKQSTQNLGQVAPPPAGPAPGTTLDIRRRGR